MLTKEKRKYKSYGFEAILVSHDGCPGIQLNQDGVVAEPQSMFFSIDQVEALISVLGELQSISKKGEGQ